MESNEPYQKLKPKIILLLYLSVIFFSIVYYIVGTTFFNSTLTYFEYLMFTSILAVVIAGGYQLFFWTQHNSKKFKTRIFSLPIDEKIPFIPQFIWIYNLSYYVIIGMVVSIIPSFDVGIRYVFGGLVLLSIQCLIFYFFPATVPKHWRDYEPKGLSSKLLNLTQKIDAGRNCMPSMHMSVAMYISLLLFPVFSYYAFIFVVLIAISCAVVKQHVLLDLPPGVLLGWLVYLLVI